MIVFDPQKTLCPEKIPKGGITRLKISFRAAGELRETDIVLAMDRSGSMGGPVMGCAVRSAIAMIEDLQKCGRGCCSCLPEKCCLGLISYADCATAEVGLETCTDPVKAALKNLKPGGNTNHQAAMDLAGEMLKGSRAGRKILILFTDGKSNRGCPELAAQKLRDHGVEIFCIGLNVDACYLKQFASRPYDTHIATVENLCCLETAFRQTGENLAGGRLQAKLLERVAEEFKILKIKPPSCGKARALDYRTVEWTLDTGNDCCGDPICLELEVAHRGCRTGCFPINESLIYEDSECRCLNFPNPCIEVGQEACVSGDCCPCYCCAVADPCRDRAQACCTETKLSGLGRVVEVTAVIRNVCPGKRVGAAVILWEVDLEGKEHNLGMKTYEIPAQKGEGCRDVTLECIQFVVPESTRVWGECQDLCSPRCFRARVIANYLDTDYECCCSLCEI